MPRSVTTALSGPSPWQPPAPSLDSSVLFHVNGVTHLGPRLAAFAQCHVSAPPSLLWLSDILLCPLRSVYIRPLVAFGLPAPSGLRDRLLSWVSLDVWPRSRWSGSLGLALLGQLVTLCLPF